MRGVFCVFKQETAYEMSISDGSLDVCSSDLIAWALVFLRRHHKLRPLLTILEGASEQGIDSSVVRSMLAMVIDDVPTAFAIVETISLQAEKPEGFRAFELGAAANLSGYRSEEHTSELQSLMRISYAGLCLKKQ